MFLAPALLVYTAVMILPLIETLRLSLFNVKDGQSVFVGFGNFQVLFGDPRWAASFWNALRNNFVFFLIHMLVQNPIGVALGRTAFRAEAALWRVLPHRDVPADAPVFRDRRVHLEAHPVADLGCIPYLLDLVGLKSLFSPWLGKPDTALIAVSLISVWQYVGIPMMLIYAAMLNIPDEVLEAAECDGVTGWSQFWKIKLPLILPSIGIISILTFVGNFNAFDLIYTVQGAIAGPDGSTDILGTLLYRTFFGFQRSSAIKLDGRDDRDSDVPDHFVGRSTLPFPIQRRMRRYQF